ncbi:MICOS complex subunit MIC60-like isoform X12 [Branchiostoma floridae]|uniref:MICOS complex subunit MIC60 n=1 Tax=Branchiostoma floridae TaxID=7739 RepID=A0A9J7MPP9_BRAFL|nr:MICOS complex subunit MIC60-like isoform X12 [Branchiostoma floridae]
MWRASRRVPSRIKCLGQGRPTSRAQQPCRNYAEEGADKSAKAAQARLQAVGSLPTETSSGGVGRTILTATLAVGAGVGGLTVYAKSSPEFRKTLEGNIPYAREYLGAVLDRGPKMPDLGLGGVVDKAKDMVGMGKKKEEQLGSFLPKLSKSKADEEEKQRKAAADTAAQAIAYGVDQPYPAEAKVSSSPPPVKYIPTHEKGTGKDEESPAIAVSVGTDEPMPVAAKEPSAAHKESATKRPAKEKKPVGVEKPEATAAAAIAASMDEPLPPESKSEPKAKKKAEDKPATKKKALKEKAEDTAAAAVAAGMDLPIPAKAMTTSGEAVTDKHVSKEEKLVETPEDTAAAAVAAALDQPFATEARETPMRTPEEVQAKLLEKEIDDLADRAATLAIIQHELQDLKRTATSAIHAQEEAAHATKMHSEQIKHAMDEDTSGPLGKEEQWQAVTGAKEAQVDALKQAEATAAAARENLEKVRAVIKQGKSSLSEPDQEILSAEEELGKLAYELETAVGKVSKAQADAQVMQEYQALVEQGRKQFKKELESIMPDVKLGGWRGKLSEDELNSLIAHAHRRIEQLQSQLAEQQLLEKSRMDDALARQRTEDEKETLALLSRELERQKRELALAQDLRIAQARDQYEAEMRTQLRRQAGAHSEHLQDVLRVQEQELSSKHQAEMHDALMDERDRYQVKLNEAMARLRGVEAAIEGRADIEREARKAQELLIACETLKRLINTGNEEAASWEERRIPLSREVNTVKEAAGDSKFFQTLLGSVPQQAMEAGVFPEDSLRQRFLRVKRVCRRVAMIDETGGTLFQFFVSYLQSLLLVDAGRRSLPPGKEVDPKKLDTFTLLSYAEHSLENGDLEQAARFMNQLKGEPRKVASDWLEEARLTLEARQAAQALAAAAAAVGLGNLV